MYKPTNQQSTCYNVTANCRTELGLRCCRRFVHSAGFRKAYEVLTLTVYYSLTVSQYWQFRFLHGICHRSKSICCKDIVNYSCYSHRAFFCIQCITQQNALSKIHKTQIIKYSSGEVTTATGNFNFVLPCIIV